MALNIQRLNFDPVTGDNPSEAYMKLDLDIGVIAEAIDGDGTPENAGIDGRLAAVETVVDGLGSAATKDVGTEAGTVAAGDDGRFVDLDQRITAAKAVADAALPKAGGALTGNVTTTGGITMTGAAASLVVRAKGIFGVNDVPAGTLDVRTGLGGFLFRTNSGTNEAIIDAVTDNNGGFAGFQIAGTAFSYISRTADVRQIFRAASGGISMDAVNANNSAFRPQFYTGTAFTFNGGNVQVNGNITASGSITPSDERLKQNIQPRSITRGMALALAGKYAEWDLISNGLHQAGVTAQNAQAICPFHVSELDYTPPPTFEEGSTELTYLPSVKRLAVDNVGMALEACMDNALSIEELRQSLATALERIAVLESR